MIKKSKKTRKGKKPNYAKGWETRRRNATLAVQVHSLHPTLPANTQAQSACGRDIAAAQSEARKFVVHGTSSFSDGLAPATSSEPPESEFAIKARAIMVAARKKNAQGPIEDTLKIVALQAAFETNQRLIQNHDEHLKSIHETSAINIVAGFIAEMETIEKLNHGIPHTIITSGRTIARVVDALIKAGYSKQGWKQPDRREEIMNRSRPVGQAIGG